MANEEYVQDHPNAVQDELKARVMAEAGGPDEASAAELRTIAMNYDLAGTPFTSDKTMVDEFRELTEQVEGKVQTADKKEEEAAKLYDRLAATKR